jgi:Ca2+-binding RTX toxin-like protein
MVVLNANVRSAVVGATALALLGLLAVGAHPADGDGGPCSGPSTPANERGEIVGTDGDDILIGTETSDIMYGKSGDDILCGLGGGEGPMDGGPGSDVLYGGDGGDDFMSGGTGADRLFGENGQDGFYPGPGRDEADAGDGGAVVYYHLIRGSVSVDLARGVARNREGDDTLTAVTGVFGTNGDDQLRGSGAEDFLFGDRGDDRIKGRGTADILIGGSGQDKAGGGTGRDQCSAERTRSCERDVPGF